MKKTLLQLAFVFSAFHLAAQNPMWVKTAGSSADEDTRDIGTDADGNVYITGTFSGTVDFDPSTGTTSLTAPSAFSDAYLAKYTSSGNLIWVRQLTGTEHNFSSQMSVTATGDVYLTGFYSGSMNVDPITTNITLVSTGAYDAFLAKYNSSGTLVWAKTFGCSGSADDYASAIVLDNTGHVYVGGSFNGSGDFDPGTGTVTLSTAGSTDAFLSKFDGDGNLMWTKSMGGTNGDAISGLASNGTDIFATGNFRNTADFDPSAGTLNLISAGLSDAFVLRMTASGTTTWAKRLGGAVNDYAARIAVDGNSNVYSVGNFASNDADFDPANGTSAVLYPAGSSVAGYLSKLDANGNYVTAVHITGGSSSVTPNSIRMSGTNQLMMVGSFTNSAVFDPFGSAATNLTSAGGMDLFMATYGLNGSLLNVNRQGGPNDDNATCVTNPAADVTYIGGHFGNDAVFSTNPSQTLTAGGYSDLYFMKYAQCSPSSGTDIQAHCGSYTWINGMEYTTSNFTATHTLTNAMGCDSVVTLNLTINANPNSDIGASGANLSALTSGLSYQWINCDNNQIIAGETFQNYTATANGNYAVIVNNGTCTDTSACVLVAGLSIDESEVSLFSMSPNPSSNVLTVTIDRVAEAHLVTTDGKALQTFPLIAGKNEISLANYPVGMYYIVVDGVAQPMMKQ